eukprot:gene28182-31278_t
MPYHSTRRLLRVTGPSLSHSKALDARDFLPARPETKVTTGGGEDTGRVSVETGALALLSPARQSYHRPGADTSNRRVSPAHIASTRALLLKEAIEDILRSKRERYQAWRRKKLGGVKLGKKIFRLIGRSDIKLGDMINNVKSSWQTVCEQVPGLKSITRRNKKLD